MKESILLTVSLLLFLTSSAQMQPDSLNHSIEDAVMGTTVDSVDARRHYLNDTFRTCYNEVDSIRKNFNHKADSLQNQYNDAIFQIDTRAASLQHTIDSLARLDLPSTRESKTLDSLNRAHKSIRSKYASRLNALKSKATAKLNSLSLSPEYKTPLQEMTQKINNVGPDAEITEIPELKLPHYDVPPPLSLSSLKSKAGGIGVIQNVSDLPKIDTELGDIGGISQQLRAYQDDVKNVTSGNIHDMQQLPQTIEQQASKLEGMGELQKHSRVVDQHKTTLAELNDPQKAKEKAVTMVRKAAVDHFAGKEQQLKAAMDKISEYKQKYASAPSIKDLPKRPPNAMKGKPLIERLVPGFYLQYQRMGQYLLDVNPYLGYKLSGKFTIGMGWNQRFAYDRSAHSFNSRIRIFGPRAFVDFKLGKGFIAHVEGEWMDSFVPSTITGSPDTGRREWVFSLMTGLKKEYRIYKNLKGTAVIQYNLIDRYYKAPYVDRLNSRIGFEYVLKRKARKNDE